MEYSLAPWQPTPVTKFFLMSWTFSPLVTLVVHQEEKSGLLLVMFLTSPSSPHYIFPFEQLCNPYCSHPISAGVMIRMLMPGHKCCPVLSLSFWFLSLGNCDMELTTAPTFTELQPGLRSPYK